MKETEEEARVFLTKNGAEAFQKTLTKKDSLRREDSEK